MRVSATGDPAGARPAALGENHHPTALCSWCGHLPRGSVARDTAAGRSLWSQRSAQAPTQSPSCWGAPAAHPLQPTLEHLNIGVLL